MKISARRGIHCYVFEMNLDAHAPRLASWAVAGLTCLLSAGCGARSSLSLPEPTVEEPVCAVEGAPCGGQEACCNGQCNDGLCLPPVCAPGDAPVALFKSNERLAGLRLDGTFVYFTHYDEIGSVRRVPKAGGDVETLVSASNWSETLAIDASSIYFIDDDHVSRVPKDGGEVTVLAADQKGAGAVTWSGDHLYWINPSSQTIWRMPASGGAPELLLFDQLLSTSEVPTLIVDDAMIYWSALGVRGAPKQGGAIVTITDTTTTSVATDQGHLYWAQPGYVSAFDPSVLDQPAKVIRAGKSGGEEVTLAENTWTQIGPSIALDDASIYFTDPSAEELNRAPKGGGPKVRLAGVRGSPYMLAVDASCVYFVSYEVSEDGTKEGAVMRLPRRLPGE